MKDEEKNTGWDWLKLSILNELLNTWVGTGWFEAQDWFLRLGRYSYPCDFDGELPAGDIFSPHSIA